MSKYHLIFEKNRNIDEIKSYFLDEEKVPIKYLPNFNKINIIVGANNSGKSRFMRYLMSNNRFIGIDEKLFIKYNLIIKQLFNKGGNYSNLIELQLNTENENLIKHNNALASDYLGINNSRTLELKKISDDLIQEIEIIDNYFIPTLRTAHSLFDESKKKIEKDIFLSTINFNYNLSQNIHLDVFTGINLYREILNVRNSEKSIREEFENFEEFLKINFFDNKQIDIVAKYVDKNDTKNENELILIHIAGEKETRKLYQLGDGIQAIIILMYKIFMAKPNSFIYIDEPELNLHPGMQRLFLQQICDNDDLKKKNLTYIISTHSNHLLDLTIEKEDVSIYSFSPKNNENGEKQFTIKNVNAGDNQILKNLGVNNSSVFMANCSIWVEGISDRNYIKAFLKSYCDFIKKPFPKEDIDFAFFEYAGSNIDHYIFENKIEKEDEEIVLNDIRALSISNRIFLLADSDATTKTNKSKYERLKTLEKNKTKNFIPKIIWNLREIENLLTNEMWKKILIEFCSKTLVKTNEVEIQKRIEDALLVIDSKNYSKKYIGTFLEDLRNNIGTINNTYVLNRSTYQVKSEKNFGTITNKRELSELFFNKNFSWDILSKNKKNKEIINLTKEIYDFILNK